MVDATCAACDSASVVSLLCLSDLFPRKMYRFSGCFPGMHFGFSSGLHLPSIHVAPIGPSLLYPCYDFKLDLIEIFGNLNSMSMR